MMRETEEEDDEEEEREEEEFGDGRNEIIGFHDDVVWGLID